MNPASSVMSEYSYCSKYYICQSRITLEHSSHTLCAYINNMRWIMRTCPIFHVLFLQQLPTMAQHVEETQHTHLLEGVQRVHGIDDFRLPTAAEYVKPVADVRHSEPVDVVRQGPEDAVVYDCYMRKERRSSAPPERSVQHQGVTTENGRQRSRQSQFIVSYSLCTGWARPSYGSPSWKNLIHEMFWQLAATLFSQLLMYCHW